MDLLDQVGPMMGNRLPLGLQMQCRQGNGLSDREDKYADRSSLFFPLTVDYILFIKADVDLDANPNEVRDTAYVTADKLKEMFEDPSLVFTPWFKLICHSMLFEWWAHLDSGLDKYKNETQIRRM